VLMEMIRPSLEEALVIQTRAVAQSYIGKRGSTMGVAKEKRIEYARQILQKETLPHVGVSEYCETKKAYFLGYVVHRVLLSALRRRHENAPHAPAPAAPLAQRRTPGRARRSGWASSQERAGRPQDGPHPVCSHLPEARSKAPPLAGHPSA